MTHVLMITGNPKPLELSYSRRLGQMFRDTYARADVTARISVLDLYADHVPLIDADVMTGWGKLAQQQPLDPHEARKVERLSALVDQFLAADLVVFALPMWNFGYPPMVKAYMDAIAVAGRTFQYTERGPVGLTSGKHAVILEARGSVWSEGPAQSMEHSVSHLRTFLGFLGITDVQTVFAEDLGTDPTQSETIFNTAARRAEALAQTCAHAALQA
ncbi:FMN-dependent NADH-azoreductase [Deinococcus metalli]|uniref:FMN dependent NADH:quinone oxidoreductase n=1 Tax=Deinococcus metalli TaxID=1141878 RepID=A0A7W8KC27_9DEIO|nr:FMN-dependent NADH-azoreductase [Deinococcus metalli]MBB5375180.1 FMN-dependent NADH-azoreductase [Deinococcus metalli]GHF31149.1 FMN-dependent NADH-azoreductase [Deinococcus metalli]